MNEQPVMFMFMVTIKNESWTQGLPSVWKSYYISNRCGNSQCNLGLDQWATASITPVCAYVDHALTCLRHCTD